MTLGQSQRDFLRCWHRHANKTYIPCLTTWEMPSREKGEGLENVASLCTGICVQTWPQIGPRRTDVEPVLVVVSSCWQACWHVWVSEWNQEMSSRVLRSNTTIQYCTCSGALLPNICINISRSPYAPSIKGHLSLPKRAVGSMAQVYKPKVL